MVEFTTVKTGESGAAKLEFAWLLIVVSEPNHYTLVSAISSNVIQAGVTRTVEVAASMAERCESKKVVVGHIEFVDLAFIWTIFYTIINRFVFLFYAFIKSFLIFTFVIIF